MDLNTAIRILTDKKGMVAALIVVLGLIGGVLGVLRPWLPAKVDPPDLILSRPQVFQPPPDSEAGVVVFELSNRGGGKVVMKSLRIKVLDCRPSKLQKGTQAGAEVTQIAFKIELDPRQREYDLLRRAFGPPLPLRSYEKNEVESAVVEITSTEPQWYEFEFIIEWYDVASPDTLHKLRSPSLKIEFPKAP